MKVWLCTHTGSGHSINIRPLAIFDDVEKMGIKIYGWWEKHANKQAKEIPIYKANNWQHFFSKPISFFAYVNNYIEFVIYVCELNGPKKKLTGEAVMRLLESDKRCNKLFTKAMLKN